MDPTDLRADSVPEILRTALAEARLVAIVLDRDGRVIWANQTALDLVSEPDETADVEAVDERLRRPQNLHPARTAELEVITPRGLFGVEATITAIDDVTLVSFPPPAALQGHEASAAERRLEFLLENTNDIITVIDRAGEIQFSNAAAGRLWGMSGVDANGMNAVDLVHPDDQVRATEALASVISGEHDGSPVEVRLRHGDGEWRDVEVLIVDRLDDPTIGGLVLTVRDISARIEATRELRRREKLMRSLVENLRDVVVLLDRDLKVVFASPAIEQLVDAPAYTNVGESAFNDIHPDDLDAVGSTLIDILARPGGSDRVEFRIHHQRRGWRWVDTTVVNCLEEPGVEGLVCTLRDITVEKETGDVLEEAYRRELDEALRRRQADHQKDDFLATVSHELRTPLTAIKGFASVIARDLGRADDEQQLELLGRIEANATEMGDMIDRMLGIARLETEHVELSTTPVDPAALIDQLLERMAPLVADYDVATDVRVDVVVADQVAVTHILRNLISNATKFSPAGSTITITVAPHDDGVLFSVADEGVGIRPEIQGQVFDRFFQDTEALPAGVRGVGVGLNIARRHVQLHGGHMWLDSEPGIGTTFFFTLPDR